MNVTGLEWAEWTNEPNLKVRAALRVVAKVFERQDADVNEWLKFAAASKRVSAWQRIKDQLETKL